MALGVFPFYGLKTIYLTDYNKFNVTVYYLLSRKFHVASLKDQIQGRSYLPNATKSLKLLLFADDTNAFCEHSSLAELEDIVNRELSCLAESFRINKLSINTKKSCYIIFSSLNKRKDNFNIKLKIDGCSISQIASTNFLGIYIDQFLTWNEHIKIIANKLTKNIGIVRKISHLLSTKILTSLYNTLIDPYLSYGNIVWASNYESRIRCL